MNHNDYNEIMKYLADLLTSSRIIFSVFIFFFVVNKSFEPALIFFLVALITDLLDGRLARRYKTSFKKGAVFDVAADYLFLSSGFLALVFNKTIPLEIFITCFILGIAYILLIHFNKKPAGQKFTRMVENIGYGAVVLFLSLYFASEISPLAVPLVIIFLGLVLYLNRARAREFLFLAKIEKEV